MICSSAFSVIRRKDKFEGFCSDKTSSVNSTLHDTQKGDRVTTFLLNNFN